METAKRKRQQYRRPARAGQNSSPSEKMQASFKRSLPQVSVRWLRLGLAALAVLLIIVGFIFWFYKDYSSPEHVFWGMVGNNLSTAGITRETNQTTCLPVNAEMSNTIQVTFVPKLQIHCITKVASGQAILTIESIGNQGGDYQHYLKISQPGTSPDKLGHIYSIWLKNNGDPKAEAKLYTLILNDPALFGSFSQVQREQLMAVLKQAYRPNFRTAVRQQKDGRGVYVYNVDLVFRKYAEAEKLFAQMLGLPIANRINPSNYAPNNHISLDFTVDILSRQLKQTKTQYLAEQYSGYGIQNPAKIPSRISTNADLQKAFQKLSR